MYSSCYHNFEKRNENDYISLALVLQIATFNHQGELKYFLLLRSDISFNQDRMGLQESELFYYLQKDGNEKIIDDNFIITEKENVSS